MRDATETQVVPYMRWRQTKNNSQNSNMFDVFYVWTCASRIWMCLCVMHVTIADGECVHDFVMYKKTKCVINLLLVHVGGGGMACRWLSDCNLLYPQLSIYCLTIVDGVRGRKIIMILFNSKEIRKKGNALFWGEIERSTGHWPHSLSSHQPAT